MVKQKYKIIIVDTIYGAFVIRKVISLNSIKPVQKVGGLQLQINVKTPTFIDKNGISTFYFESKKGSQLNFKQIQPYLSPDDLDIIIGQKIIREIAAGVLDNKKEKMMVFFMGVLIGLMAGCLIMMLVMQQKIDEIYAKFLNENTIPIVPFSFKILKFIRRW